MWTHVIQTTLGRGCEEHEMYNTMYTEIPSLCMGFNSYFCIYISTMYIYKNYVDVLYGMLVIFVVHNYNFLVVWYCV